MLLTSAWLFSSVKSTKDPVQRCYENFCGRLTKIGLSKLPNEGPKEFSQRAARQRPDIADRILVISELYLRLRYGPLAGSVNHFLQFRNLVRGFRPAKVKKLIALTSQYKN